MLPSSLRLKSPQQWYALPSSPLVSPCPALVPSSFVSARVEVAHCLIHIFKFMGPPLILHSDNGREFASLAHGKHVPISDM